MFLGQGGNIHRCNFRKAFMEYSVSQAEQVSSLCFVLTNILLCSVCSLSLPLQIYRPWIHRCAWRGFFVVVCFVYWGVAEPNPLLLRPLNGLLYQPRMMMLMISVEQVLGENLPLCPPQIPHDLTRAWTRAAAVVSRRLTSWATTRPCKLRCCNSRKDDGVKEG
jgi:hypothetical protein